MKYTGGAVKIIFLDFDGVLNYLSMEGAVPWTDGLVAPRIAPDCIVELNRLHEMSGAHIVVSSSWRLGRLRSWLADMLWQNGLRSTCAILGKTPNYDQGHERGHEIAWWLEATHFKVDGIVILDDSSDMAFMKPWHVQTDPHFGLTAKDAGAAFQVLNSGFDVGKLPRSLA